MLAPTVNSEPRLSVNHAAEFMCDVAMEIRDRSEVTWGPEQAVEIIGRSPCFVEVQRQIKKVAKYREPVLITGQSGVGKELIAKAIYLLSDRAGRPYVSVNCPQYREGNLTASELFGHRKGSFTGAIANHKGAFENADGGVIFLDEVADLHPSVQAMLLRTVATGEFQPVGSQEVQFADLRIVAATNRDLKNMVVEREFRNDLYFRLRYFLVSIPPLCLRGDDWRLIAEYLLIELRHRYDVAKRFSPSSLKLLETCSWPGNVRQLLSVVTMGYAMSDSDTIEPEDFACQLDQMEETPRVVSSLYERITVSGEDFWQAIHRPFMARDLNRSQVKALIKQGLITADGSYQQLLDLVNLPPSNYQKFMDFLRHHDLKP